MVNLNFTCLNFFSNNAMVSVSQLKEMAAIWKSTGVTEWKYRVMFVVSFPVLLLTSLYKLRNIFSQDMSPTTHCIYMSRFCYVTNQFFNSLLSPLVHPSPLSSPFFSLQSSKCLLIVETVGFLYSF